MKRTVPYSKTREYENTECWKLSLENKPQIDEFIETIEGAHKSRSGEYWFVPTTHSLESIRNACGQNIELIPEANLPQKKQRKPIKDSILPKLPVIIPLCIVGFITLAIFFFDIVIKSFFTAIMAGALIAPLVMAIRDKKHLFSGTKIAVIAVSGALIFIMGIWGYINIADIVKPVVCPAGFERVVNEIDSWSTDDGESFEMNYFAAGELGTFQIDTWTVIWVSALTFLLYAFILQFIGFGVNKLTARFRFKNKLLDKTASISLHLLAPVLFLSIINLLAAKDTFITQPVLKTFNNIIYPGQTLSIIEASRKNKLEIVAMLLQDNADFLAMNSKGESALYIAQTLKNNQLIDKFKQKLADYNPGVITLIEKGYSFYDSTFIYYIQNNDSKAVHTYLDAGFQVSPKSGSYYPLYTAVVNNRPEMVTLLIERGAPVNNTDTVTLDPLLAFAVKAGFSDIMKLLIEAGADTSFRDTNGNTILHLASQAGSSSIVAYLVGTDIEIDAKNNIGETPLLTACRNLYEGRDAAKSNRFYQVIELLGKNGADPDIQNKEGWAPVMYAALYNHIPLLEYLLSREVDVNARLYVPFSDGTTALLIAEKKYFHQTAGMLRKAGAVD